MPEDGIHPHRSDNPMMEAAKVGSGKTSEQKTVEMVERSLTAGGRYYLNVFGDVHADNGSPDIVTMDSDGRFVGIECKSLGKEPVFTQYQHAVRILNSNGNARYVVAYEDFSLEALDGHSLPTAAIGCDEVDGAFAMSLEDKTRTVELVLAGASE